MSFMEWSDKFELKISDIDQQHKQLLSMVNEMHDAMKNRKGKDVLADILKRLIDYTQKHFATEEKYFETHHYPDSLKHKMEHKALTQKVIELNEKFNKGDLFITVEVMNFIRDWLTNHILKSDLKYGSYLRERGVR
ncbi:MAG: hemerythrin family protein [Desulfobacterales bacterium]|nr:hemerythrin family protein [Desulfobacterales bacterium]